MRPLVADGHKAGQKPWSQHLFGLRMVQLSLTYGTYGSTDAQGLENYSWTIGSSKWLAAWLCVGGSSACESIVNSKYSVPWMCVQKKFKAHMVAKESQKPVVKAILYCFGVTRFWFVNSHWDSLTAMDNREGHHSSNNGTWTAWPRIGSARQREQQKKCEQLTLGAWI